MVCDTVTLEDGTDNELTFVKMDELPENLSSSITDTLEGSPSLSGVSVEDFVSFIVNVEGTFMSASYNLGDSDVLPVTTYVAFKEESQPDLYQPLMTGEGASLLKPIEGDFGQEFYGREISSVVIIVLAEGTENTTEILKIVKEALTIKVCGE